MFKTFFDALKRFFLTDPFQHNLDRYIASHNPQCEGDVDRLEREYLKRYYF